MVGEQIGRYRIDEEVGRGGMGVVYRATQVTLNRTVAVKMLPRQSADEENLERFRREAQTLAQLAHQGIVHIYDVEEHEGSHFIIMEFVDGGDLGDAIKEEAPLPVDRAVEITAQVASALSAAHRRGIIHRDIKPDNILFNENGRAKLTDFGIAHMRDSNSKTKTGVMLGTPYYMSPEQARGRPVTPASDLYALGVLLYEMLSGVVPFSGDDAVAIAIKHIQEEPVPLVEHAPDTPPALLDIVERLMAKLPENRIASADALIEALQQAGWGVGNTTLGGTRGEASATPQSVEKTSAGKVDLKAPAALANAGEALAQGAKRIRSAAGSASVSGKLNAPSVGGMPRSFWLGAVVLGVVALLVVLPQIGGGSAGANDSGEILTPAVGPTPSGPPLGPQGSQVSVNPEDVAGLADILDGGNNGNSGSQGGSAGNGGNSGGGGSQGGGGSGGSREVEPITPERDEESETGREETVFDANAARRDIRALVERQRRATEASDLAAMLRDVHPELMDEAREYGEIMLSQATNLRSEVSDVEIEFEDPTLAGVLFYARLTGDLMDGQRVVLAEGLTQWALVQQGGRWLIAAW